MLQAIIQSHESLGNFLSAFRDAFGNQPQYRHFQAYVVALLIYLGSRNLAGLSRAIPDGHSACSLYRFMAEMDWDEEVVEQIRWGMLNRHTRRAVQAAPRSGQRHVQKGPEGARQEGRTGRIVVDPCCPR